MKQLVTLILLSAVIFMSGCGKTGYDFKVPVEYYKLDNGLKVVLSEDHTAPIATVAVYYNIGFRLEPQGRTGFAHLFEHMMFQGSTNMGKMEFIQLVQKNGGVLNGSTRFDFTNYFEIVPTHKIETMLWAEADRMGGLALTEENLINQKGVVTNEVKGAVWNAPYGGFPWLDMPQYANENWYNAHNFYGDLAEIEASKLDEVQDFFDTYYIPNNAALIVTGDFEKAEVKGWIEKYYGPIPAKNDPPDPDISEPYQTEEKKFIKDDKLANRPATAFAYHVPERGTPEYYAMGVIDQILLQGEDSRLFQALVKEKGYTGNINGGVNALLGNMYNYKGPMLWMASFFYDNQISEDDVMSVVDEVVAPLRETPIGQDELDQAMVKLRSALYGQLGGFFGFGKADLLACFALFDDDPSKINEIEDHFKTVTPELILKTAKEYLRPENRTVLTINPLAAK